MSVVFAGQAVTGRPEESQVSPGGGGSHDTAGCLQLLEEQQVLQRLVLRKLCADQNAEESSGRAETDARHHGQVCAGSCLLLSSNQ